MLSIRYAVKLLLLLLVVVAAQAGSPVRLFDLSGQWKFEIGDDPARAAYGFNDSKWESIHAPAPWEDEGFPGYDGYAWYRKHFRSTPDWENKALSVHINAIDDVDQVFINGHLIGSTGTFPPHYTSAWSYQRNYVFPPSLLNPSGDNVIAVRVYDDELNGGMISGPIAIYEDVPPLPIRISLVSGWTFRTGDDMSWKEERLNDAPSGDKGTGNRLERGSGEWKPIIVPRYWEPQGYEDYDGFAWYRITFRAPADVVNEHLILLLGKIDDLDETYLNGEEIGHTGNMWSDTRDVRATGAWQKLRAYTIPAGVLHPGAENVIAVRVFDGYKDGGIYEGPIGIVTRTDFAKWQRHESKSNGFLDWLDDLLHK